MVFGILSNSDNIKRYTYFMYLVESLASILKPELNYCIENINGVYPVLHTQNHSE